MPSNNSAQKVNAEMKQHCYQAEKCDAIHPDKLQDRYTQKKVYHCDGVHLQMEQTHWLWPSKTQ